MEMLQQIAIIVFGAVLALWLTNLDQQAKSIDQLKAYYQLEMDQNWEIVTRTKHLYDHFNSDIQDAFFDEESEADADLRAVVAEKGLDENEINYSGMAIQYSNPEIMADVYRAINKRNEELQLLKACYEEDQSVTPRVYFELYHVAFQAYLASVAYQKQLDYLDKKGSPNGDASADERYAGMAQTLQDIEKKFFYYFSTPEDDFMYHTFFERFIDGKQPQEVTWEDMEAFAKKMEALMGL
jgi:hypothetical protein